MLKYSMLVCVLFFFVFYLQVLEENRFMIVALCLILHGTEESRDSVCANCSCILLQAKKRGNEIGSTITLSTQGHRGSCINLIKYMTNQTLTSVSV